MSDQSFPRCLTSPSGLVVQVNANGSIRRMEHRDVIVNLFPGQRGRGRPDEPLSAPARRAHRRCDPAARPAQPGRRSAVDEHGLVVARHLAGRPLRCCRSCSRRRRPPGSGTSRSRTSAPRRVDGRPGLRAGPRARALRRDPHERVLREPVRRLHAARRIRGAASCWRCGRTSRWAAAIRGRCVGSLGHARRLRDRRARSSTGSRPAPARCRRRSRSRALARHAPAARALDGGRAGRGGRARAGRASRRAASSAGSSRIIPAVDVGGGPRGVERALALPEATPPAPSRRRPRTPRVAAADALRRRRRCSRATTSTTAELGASSARERRHVEAEDGHAPLVLHRRAPARRARRRRSARACARTATILRTGDGARARRGVAHVDGLDGRRLPLAGDAGPRQHQSLALDDALVPRALPRPRAARLRRASPAAGISSACRRRSR